MPMTNGTVEEETKVACRPGIYIFPRVTRLMIRLYAVAHTHASRHFFQSGRRWEMCAFHPPLFILFFAGEIGRGLTIFIGRCRRGGINTNGSGIANCRCSCYFKSEVERYICVTWMKTFFFMFFSRNDFKVFRAWEIKLLKWIAIVSWMSKWYNPCKYYCFIIKIIIRVIYFHLIKFLINNLVIFAI